MGSIHSKGTQLLHGRFVLFNSAHFGHGRSKVEISGEFIKVFGRADGVYLHGTVRFITDPSGQAQFGSFCGHKVTESDAMHTSGYHPASGFPALPLWITLAQWMNFSGSGFGAHSIATFTASRNSLRVNGFIMIRKPSSSTNRCTTCRS
jgi:hypothetical protein